MQCTDQEFAQLVKNFEEECNKHFFELTNTEEFANLLGEELELHVDHVVFIRKVTSEWLACTESANRDDLAEIALTLIDCESRVDTLEEDLYNANRTFKKNKESIINVGMELRKLFNQLLLEHGKMKKEKRNCLEREINELKQLF